MSTSVAAKVDPEKRPTTWLENTSQPMFSLKQSLHIMQMILLDARLHGNLKLTIEENIIFGFDIPDYARAHIAKDQPSFTEGDIYAYQAILKYEKREVVNSSIVSYVPNEVYNKNKHNIRLCFPEHYLRIVWSEMVERIIIVGINTLMNVP